MGNDELIRCPHCGALVDRDPTDDKQYCQACHELFSHADAEPSEADPLGAYNCMGA